MICTHQGVFFVVNGEKQTFLEEDSFHLQVDFLEKKEAKRLTTLDKKTTTCKTCDIRGLQGFPRKLKTTQKYFLSTLFGIITLGIIWKNIRLDDRQMPFLI